MAQSEIKTAAIVGGAILLGASGVFGNSVKEALHTAWDDLKKTFNLKGGPERPGGGRQPDLVTPRSLASDYLGRELWNVRHGDGGAGYDQLSRADQITWNSVAINGA